MKEKKTELLKLRITKSLKDMLKDKDNMSAYVQDLILRDLRIQK